MGKAKAKVWCRECGGEMKQYPMDILAYGCKKCGIKATVSFEKMPILKAVNVEPIKEIKKELARLWKEKSEAEKSYNSIIKSEMDKFKGKYFKNKKEKIVRLSIFYVSDKDWDNAIDYTKCFYSEDWDTSIYIHSWWKIDEESNFDYEDFDWDKLCEAEEISKEEYYQIRKKIIELAKEKEAEEIRKKYDEIKEQNDESKNK